MAELMTQGEWDKYRRMLKAISDAAEQDFWNIAYKLSQEHGTIGILSVPRNELIELANALVQKYGEGAAEAACQMHEEIAERSGVSIPPAEPAELPEMHEVAKVVNGAAKSGSEKTVTSAVGRMVKQVGQDTTWKNAARDGAEWAWVPAGDTCAFCITLASRGWQYASKAVLKGGHVEHIHANCDCAFAIRFGKDQKVGGYDPDKYLRMYYGAEGNTSKDRINAMRRERYEENKDQINAQKREAYARRKENVSEAGRITRIAQKKAEGENLREMLRNSVTIGKPYTEPEEIKAAAFSAKFSNITSDTRINDRIRTLAQGNLTKNNGTYTEMLDIIDLDTGDLVVHKLGKKNALEISLTPEERAAVRRHKGKIIGIHNHPTNICPTGSDFVAAGARGYDFGIVVTHDCRVFKYTPPKKIVSAETIDKIIEKHTRYVYTDDEKRKGFESAMKELERRFGITWKEM